MLPNLFLYIFLLLSPFISFSVNGAFGPYKLGTNGFPEPRDLTYEEWTGGEVGFSAIVAAPDALEDKQVAKLAEDYYKKMEAWWIKNKGNTNSQRRKQPAVMTALYVPAVKTVFIASSVKANVKDVPLQVQQSLKECGAALEEDGYASGDHTNGAACGEIFALSLYFRYYPDAKALPEGRAVSVSYSKFRKANDDGSMDGFVEPCGLKGGKATWGCAQFYAHWNIHCPIVDQFSKTKKPLEKRALLGQSPAFLELERRATISATSDTTSSYVASSANASVSVIPGSWSPASAPAPNGTCYYTAPNFSEDDLSPATNKTLYTIEAGSVDVSDKAFTCVEVELGSSGDLAVASGTNATLAASIIKAIAPNGTMTYNGSYDNISFVWNTWDEGQSFCHKKTSTLHGICYDSNAQYLWTDPDTSVNSTVGRISYKPYDFLAISGNPGRDAGISC